MTFAIFESIKMNTNTTTIDAGSPIPQKEPMHGYQVLLVIPEAPEGTTREEAIQRIFMAGYHLLEGQDIRSEAEWAGGSAASRFAALRSELARVVG